ncbi:hypothetical protein [Rhizobium sp. PAMB 3182]
MTTAVNWIFGGIVVGLGAVLLYQGSWATEMEKRVAGLEKQLQAAKADVGKSLEELRSEQKSQAEKLILLGSADDVAKLLIEKHFAQMIEAVAVSLAQDPAKAARLKGEPGPAPDPDLIADRLISAGFIGAVADQIWETQHAQLAVMPEVLAEVAEAVYLKYGLELKGTEGRTVTAEEVAAALALNQDFIAMVEDLDLERSQGTDEPHPQPPN